MYWKRQNSTFVIHSFICHEIFNVNIYKSWIYLWWWKLIWKAKKSSSSMVSSALFSGIKNSFPFLIIIRPKRHLFWRNKYFHCFFSSSFFACFILSLFPPFSFSFLPFSCFFPPFPFFFLSFLILVSEGRLPPRGYHLETGYGDVRPWDPLFTLSQLFPKIPISACSFPLFNKNYKFYRICRSRA